MGHYLQACLGARNLTMLFDNPILHQGDMMFDTEPNWNNSKPTLLIFASCHGRTLLEYFRYARPDILEKYNILRLETGPMTLTIQKGIDLFAHPAIREVFAVADVVATYNMGARMRHHELTRVSKLFKPGAKVITMAAPNFSAFCPFSFDGYGAHLGILTALDQGKSPAQLWSDYEHGQFDPMFAVRWRLEIGRHQDKGGYSDIGLTAFIIAHYKKAKLWMGPSHPTYHIMSYLGSEIGGLMGFPKHTDEQILGFNYDRGMVSGQPETEYEFNYFGFQYPRRYTSDENCYYRRCFELICESWKTDGFVRPIVD